MFLVHNETMDIVKQDNVRGYYVAKHKNKRLKKWKKDESLFIILNFMSCMELDGEFKYLFAMDLQFCENWIGLYWSASIYEAGV